MKKLPPILFIILVTVTLSAVLFLPGLSTMFNGPGFSTAIFLIGLFTSHWAIFFPTMPAWIPLVSLPIIWLTQFLVLQFSFGNPDLIRDSLFGGNPLRYSEFLDMGYGGIYRTMIIQTLISLGVSAGLWMGRKHGKFVYRKAGKDLEEQEQVYSFRNRFHNEEPPTFFKYRTLMKWGQTFLGIKKDRILGMINSLRLEDTLVLYDLHVDPEYDEPDMDLNLVQHAIVRPEILTSNISEVVLVLPANINGASNRFASFGFALPGQKDRERLEELLLKARSELFDEWVPFSGDKTILYAVIPENSPEEAIARRLY